MQVLSIIETETKLAFQIGGRVINKFVNVGDVVEAGQMIAQINGSDTVAQMQNAEGAVKSSSIGLRISRNQC